MATESVEEISVKLEADYQDFLKQIDRAVDEAVRKLKDVDEAPKQAQGAWGKLGDFLKSQFLPIAGSIAAAFALQNIFQGVVGFVQNLGKAAIAASAQFETFTVQFQTLLGSTSEAKKRIDELAEFGQTTPFELPEIVEADRLLQTFGGTALATGENLRRIGDSAAAVNANFQEVAFWTGRLYSAIQAGRPFGEASARLQELGILTGDVRTRLEDMQKAGASGTEIWAAYAEMIDTRFIGAMDRLSKTFQGVMSNIADFQGMLLREGGASFFEGLREDAIEFYDAINQPEVKDALVDIAKAAGDLAEMLRDAVMSPFIEGIKNIDPETLENLADSVDDFAEAVGRLLDADLKADLNTVIDLTTAVIDSSTVMVNNFNAVKDFAAPAGAALTGFLNPLSNIPRGLSSFNDALEKITGSSLGDFTRGLVDTQEELQGIEDHMDGLETTGSHALNALQQGLQNAAAAAEDTAEATSKITEEMQKVMDSAVTQFQDAVKDRAEKTEELETQHGEQMAEITEDYKQKQAEIVEQHDKQIAELEAEVAKRRTEIAERTQEALKKLEEDTAKRRAEILENTQEQLADLEESTQESIAQARKDHQEREKRGEEDHQRDMRRLQEQYLFDLEDAVKNRDARAIVDLRRRNQREKREREQDFRQTQRREGEDLDKRIEDIQENERKRRREILDAQAKQLADLAENEAERRKEIMESQAKQLADLDEYEAERRTKIEESTQEQMAKAEENYQQQMARENERYAERQAALDEALAKRLEDVAKGLADEKEINEEGAKAILETLNSFFGVGGDIDKLMEDFAGRRRQKMTIQIDFERTAEGEVPFGPNGQGPHPGAIPGFQFGGTIPGPRGAPRLIMAHAGEEIVPVSEVARLNAMRAGGGMGGELRLKLDISGSAPPGIRGAEVEQMAGMLVKALNDAGLRTRR